MRAAGQPALWMRPTLMMMCVAILPLTARAQAATRLTLKQAVADPAARPVCPSASPSPTPPDGQRQEARDLAQRARQAAILGDAAGALRSLRNASALDPSSPEITYELARAYETTIDPVDALNSYCRYLYLWPTAPDAPDALEKIRGLAPWRTHAAADTALATFRLGVAAFEAGQLMTSETSFSDVLAIDSLWAEAYYNRAQVRLARSDREGARSDLRRYLDLKPAADDRDRVAQQIFALRPRSYSSVGAFALGAIVPGGGEFYTRRFGRGAFTLVAVGAAVGVGMLQHTSMVTTHQTATDPSGNPYTITVTRAQNDRPNLVLGLGVAGGIMALSALDATIYAHFSGDQSQRVALSIAPTTNGVMARMAFAVR